MLKVANLQLFVVQTNKEPGTFEEDECPFHFALACIRNGQACKVS